MLVDATGSRATGSRAVRSRTETAESGGLVVEDLWCDTTKKMKHPASGQ
jgi:hypothetical protein